MIDGQVVRLGATGANAQLKHLTVNGGPRTVLVAVELPPPSSEGGVRVPKHESGQRS